MKKDIVKKFINLLGEQKLWPPLHNYSVFILGSEWTSRNYFGKYFSDKLNYHQLFLMDKKHSTMFVTEDGIHTCASEFFQAYLKRPKLLKERANYFFECFAEVDKIYQELNYDFVEKTSLNKLLAICEQVRFLMWDPNAATYASVFFEKEFCWREIEKANFNISRKEFEAIWDRASEPVAGSFDKQQLIHILELFIQEKSWAEIIEECQYFYSSYRDAKNLAIVSRKLKKQYGHLRDREIAASLLVKEKREEAVRQKKFANWYVRLTKNQKIIVDYLQAIIAIRDNRKNFFNKGVTVWWRVAQKMFRAADIPEKYIIYLTFLEFKRGLVYLKKRKHDIMKRESGFGYVVPYAGRVSYEAMNVNEFKQLRGRIMDYFLQSQIKQEDIQELKGNIGSPGKVSGRVRIVINAHKKNNFQSGDVLVAGMTRPEFVPLMKKSAAIITDEGGITCHAAIVSRELKKPCIIGTKIATKVLKDGDLVEVDADKGVVKILERRK